MGLTGKKTLALKLAYSDTFNRMEAQQQKSIYDRDQIALAHRAAVIATAKVSQSEVDAVIQAKDWQLNRYMLHFGITAEKAPWPASSRFSAMPTDAH